MSGESYSFTLVTADNLTTVGSFSVPIGKLTTRIDPPEPAAGVPVTVTVTVVDAQTGARVPGAVVKINGTDQFPTNAPFAHTFKCQHLGILAAMVCDNVVVS